jgi:hypothetical protein
MVLAIVVMSRLTLVAIAQDHEQDHAGRRQGADGPQPHGPVAPRLLARRRRRSSSGSVNSGVVGVERRLHGSAVLVDQGVPVETEELRIGPQEALA